MLHNYEDCFHVYSLLAVTHISHSPSGRSVRRDQYFTRGLCKQRAKYNGILFPVRTSFGQRRRSGKTYVKSVMAYVSSVSPSSDRAKRSSQRRAAPSPLRREAPSLDLMSRRTREDAHRRMRISLLTNFDVTETTVSEPFVKVAVMNDCEPNTKR